MTDPRTPGNKSDTDSVSKEIEAWREDLRGLADEIKLKIHLGGMDAKDAWKRLEPRIDEFERKAQGVSEQVGKELRHVSSSLRADLKKLRDRLS